MPRRQPLFERDFSHIDRSLLNTTLDEQVRIALVEYVTLHKTRGDVLYHMYFIGGCGYHWIEGKLIDPYPERATLDIFPNYSTGSDAWDAIIGGAFREIMEQEEAERQIAIQELEQRASNSSFGQEYTNPDLEYSNFFFVPEDADTEYVRGAIEVGEELLKHLDLPTVTEELEYLRGLLAHDKNH